MTGKLDRKKFLLLTLGIWSITDIWPAGRHPTKRSEMHLSYENDINKMPQMPLRTPQSSAHSFIPGKQRKFHKGDLFHTYLKTEVHG